MANHKQQDPDPRLVDKYRRRLHSPESLAPKPRSRQLQIFSVAITLVRSFADSNHSPTQRRRAMLSCSLTLARKNTASLR
ncbi:hypothetical protein BC938DRAFT_474461 [Jimgerdemannia flammicorona]|uniref:Uncharacterized protein n=1 Tax=Jimgerdemannia flammicorona TaxID=994334 RepID=A0A433QSH9_9FUNG|nr:hypothetical protein BC938DRAFT_474461 [Jimgerdemannia flammicorona]